MAAETSSSFTLETVQQAVNDFAAERDWEQFHTPKNLSMALAVEAAELMEIFQWLEGKEGTEGLSTSKLDLVEQEIADIFIYVLRFCSVTQIDLLAATNKKLKLNAQKYPAEVVKGSSAKYTEY